MKLGFLWFVIVAVARPATIQLSSGDTVITIDAGLSAPRVLRVAGWVNGAPESPIADVEIGGEMRPVQWKFQPAESSVGSPQVDLVYDSREPRLRLHWEWRIRGVNGPAEHRILIQNLSGTEMWLPLQDSLRFDFRVPPEEGWKRFWVEKGASSPSAEGTHNIDLREGNSWTGTSSTYAHPRKGAPREIIPYVLVQRTNAEQSGWYVGIEFSGRTRIALRRHGDSIAGEAGLNPNPGPYRTRLRPAEIFETPTVFLGVFKGGPDGAGNTLRHWIREVLNNPITLQNAKYPMLVSNSWGSGMAINESLADRMIEDAADLGLEMFHLDAGWFRDVGDWESNPEKFPHGVTAVAAFAHKAGLKFGLWTDWTQAGLGTGRGALNVHDPKVRDWLTTDPPADWKPKDFKGITIDIGLAAAEKWASETVAKVASKFHLDMLEHDGYLVTQGCDRPDHPHAPLDAATASRYKDEDFLWVDGSNDTDVSYHATRAYYEIQTRLRQRFPGLLLEICNDGGRMVDFGSAAHGDYFSLSDGYDPLSNRRAFFDASYVLPPAMLESYVEKWPAASIENFRYMLRSGMMGWFSLMMDSRDWTMEQREAARAEFALYKEKLRPLIRQADLYHVSDRPDGVRWDGMEYFDHENGRGVLFAFHGSSAEDRAHRFRVQGLKNDRTYKVMFQDHSSKDYIASGERLSRSGVEVRETVPNSSELVFIRQLAKSDRL